MTEVKRLLAGCSCLTLAGSGGSGKTRLALQAAAEILPDYPHGIWLVELAALTEPSLVPQTVASALGLREMPGKTLTQTLSEYARSRTLLLVLDNCEHLIAACAQLVDTLLRACPHVKILATSREPLNIAGEHVFRAPSLSSPDPQQPQTPASLRRYEASRLFIDRVASMKADFVVTDQNASALAQICHRLDGIPLAIELAAARARTLSVEDINSRLDRRFRVLTGGSRSALPRQQTLQALIDWSYDLLNDQEKLLLARLAVFAGGWTLETAEQICSGEGIEDWEALDLLTSLADKSLVLAEERGNSVRYRLLETVREYATEKLRASGDEAKRRAGHRDWFLALAETARPLLLGPEQGWWLDRLETEHDNLRAALAWSASEPDAVEAHLRLCVALARFWSARGHLGAGRAWCEAALAQAGAADRTTLRAKVLIGTGVLAFNQGDFATAKDCYEQGLAIYRDFGDQPGIADALNNLGNVARYQGDLTMAKTYQEESLAICRDLGDPLGIAYALSSLGIVALREGDFTTARSYQEQSLTIMRELGDRRGIANALGNLGNVARRQGEHTLAKASYEECLAIFRETGDQRGISTTLSNLGLVADNQGDYASARAYHEESLTIRRVLEDRLGIAESLNGLGMMALHQGDYASARAYAEKSLTIHRETGNLQGIANALSNLGSVARKQGDYSVARVCYEQSLAIFREIGDRQSVAGSLIHLGDMAGMQGDDATARTAFQESLTISQENGDHPGIVLALEAFGKLAFMAPGAAATSDTLARASEANRDLPRAARLWGAAQALRESMHAPQPIADQAELAQAIAEARAGLGEAAWDAAWAEGQSLTQAQAIACALEETGD